MGYREGAHIRDTGDDHFLTWTATRATQGTPLFHLHGHSPPPLPPPIFPTPCEKQWKGSRHADCKRGALRTVPVRGAVGGAAGGAVRGAARTVPEQRAPGALRSARAQRADNRGDAKEKKTKRTRRSTRRNTKQDGHPEQHGRQRRAGRATAPPRCLDNCANNTSPPSSFPTHPLPPPASASLISTSSSSTPSSSTPSPLSTRHARLTAAGRLLLRPLLLLLNERRHDERGRPTAAK